MWKKANIRRGDGYLFNCRSKKQKRNNQNICRKPFKNLQNKIMNTDDRDIWDVNNPDNMETIELTEMEVLEEDYFELCQRVKKARTQIVELIEIAENFKNVYIINQLKKIKL